MTLKAALLLLEKEFYPMEVEGQYHDYGRKARFTLWFNLRDRACCTGVEVVLKGKDERPDLEISEPIWESVRYEFEKVRGVLNELP